MRAFGLVDCRHLAALERPHRRPDLLVDDVEHRREPSPTLAIESTRTRRRTGEQVPGIRRELAASTVAAAPITFSFTTGRGRAISVFAPRVAAGLLSAAVEALQSVPADVALEPARPSGISDRWAARTRARAAVTERPYRNG
jgi:hypothetical protein